MQTEGVGRLFVRSLSTDGTVVEALSQETFPVGVSSAEVLLVDAEIVGVVVGSVTWTESLLADEARSVESALVAPACKGGGG
jgi:hypothetical protein